MSNLLVVISFNYDSADGLEILCISFKKGVGDIPNLNCIHSSFQPSFIVSTIGFERSGSGTKP